MLLDLPTAALYPDGFMLSDDFVDTMKAWAADFGAPVRAGVEVTAISQSGLDFLVTADGRDMTAKAVVATATYQHPRIPPVAGSIPPFIVQLHAEEYKNPAMVPDGAVIGVGSGQTGCQLVDDPNEGAERFIFVSAGRVACPAVIVARTAWNGGEPPAPAAATTMAPRPKSLLIAVTTASRTAARSASVPRTVYVTVSPLTVTL